MTERVTEYNGYDDRFGGGSSHRDVAKYVVFDNDKQFQEWLQKDGRDTSKYVVLDVTPRKVQIKVEVKVD